MQVYFFDSSGAVKRYASETGSSWVRSLLNPRSRNRVHVAHITGVEVVICYYSTRNEWQFDPGRSRGRH